ncbi:uncharacterized protein [Physcomitrium patens]|uniref:uncharacterized protein isoform X2 n=1 Tax=Physcomitrium patens TaxID=3218 RepID=UPI003CCE191D
MIELVDASPFGWMIIFHPATSPLVGGHPTRPTKIGRNPILYMLIGGWKQGMFPAKWQDAGMQHQVSIWMNDILHSSSKLGLHLYLLGRPTLGGLNCHSFEARNDERPFSLIGLLSIVETEVDCCLCYDSCPAANWQPAPYQDDSASSGG